MIIKEGCGGSLGRCGHGWAKGVRADVVGGGNWASCVYLSGCFGFAFVNVPAITNPYS